MKLLKQEGPLESLALMAEVGTHAYPDVWKKHMAWSSMSEWFGLMKARTWTVGLQVYIMHCIV